MITKNILSLKRLETDALAFWNQTNVRYSVLAKTAEKYLTNCKYTSDRLCSNEGDTRSGDGAFLVAKNESLYCPI